MPGVFTTGRPQCGSSSRRSAFSCLVIILHLGKLHMYVSSELAARILENIMSSTRPSMHVSTRSTPWASAKPPAQFNREYLMFVNFRLDYTVPVEVLAFFLALPRKKAN